MVVSKFTEHIDGDYGLLTYNEKSVSLEDILRDSEALSQYKQRSNEIDTSMAIGTGRNSNSSESSSPSTSSSSSSSVKNTFSRRESDPASDITVLSEPNGDNSMPEMKQEKGKGRRWTNAFGKKA